MNKERRNNLNSVYDTIDKTKNEIVHTLGALLIKSVEEYKEQLEQHKSDLENLRDEEQDYLDNMPESLQGGEKGSNAEDAISSMDEAIGKLDEAIDKLDEFEAIESEIDQMLEDAQSEIDNAKGF